MSRAPRQAPASQLYHHADQGSTDAGTLRLSGDDLHRVGGTISIPNGKTVLVRSAGAQEPSTLDFGQASDRRCGREITFGSTSGDHKRICTLCCQCKALDGCCL